MFSTAPVNRYLYDGESSTAKIKNKRRNHKPILKSHLTGAGGHARRVYRPTTSIGKKRMCNYARTEPISRPCDTIRAIICPEKNVRRTWLFNCSRFYDYSIIRANAFWLRHTVLYEHSRRAHTYTQCRIQKFGGLGPIFSGGPVFRLHIHIWC